MGTKKLKIFTIGYPDNTYTSYLFDYLIRHRITIDGIIFPKNNLKRNLKRTIRKYQLHGLAPALKRIPENILVRKKQISHLYQQNGTKVFYVDNINSDEVKHILLSNGAELLLLTSAIIIKPILIDIDGLTILNSHTGWLPKYRGYHANLKALRDNHQPGVSIHRVIEKIDAGEVYLREHFHINPNGGIPKQLDEKELYLAGKLLLEAVKLISKNMLKPIATNEPLGKYEPLLTKKERNKIINNLK